MHGAAQRLLGRLNVARLVEVPRLEEHHAVVHVVVKLRLRLLVVPGGGDKVPLGHLNVPLVDGDVRRGGETISVATGRLRRRGDSLRDELERRLGLVNLALIGEEDAEAVGSKEIRPALLQRLGVHRLRVFQVFLLHLPRRLVSALELARVLRLDRAVVRRVGQRHHGVLVVLMRHRVGVLPRRRGERRSLRAELFGRLSQRLELRLRFRPFPSRISRCPTHAIASMSSGRVSSARLASSIAAAKSLATRASPPPQQTLRHVRRRREKIAVPRVRVRGVAAILRESREVKRHRERPRRGLLTRLRRVQRLAGRPVDAILRGGRLQRLEERLARLLEPVRVSRARHRAEHGAVVEQRGGRRAPSFPALPVALASFAAVSYAASAPA